METQTETKRKNVYDIITARIIEQLEKGVIPWQKNLAELPKNFITMKPYRSINVLLLSAMDYKHLYFLSFKQLKELGGTVKAEEKPIPVVYWKKHEDESKKPSLRYFNVYNITQTEGIPEEKFPPRDKFNAVLQRENRIELCKEIVMNMPNKPEVILDSETTFYSVKSDYIAMQPTHFFQNAEEYYSELFRHLVHSTGNKKRLARKEFYDFAGTQPVDECAMEKLIVEIGTFILKAHCGIASNKQNTDSILAWLNKLRADRKLIVYAAFRAQQAVDYILNVPKEEAL